MEQVLANHNVHYKTCCRVFSLTYFMPLVSFYTFRKHLKTWSFLIFLRGMERDTWNGLRLYKTTEGWISLFRKSLQWSGKPWVAMVYWLSKCISSLNFDINRKKNTMTKGTIHFVIISISFRPQHSRVQWR